MLTLQEARALREGTTPGPWHGPETIDSVGDEIVVVYSSGSPKQGIYKPIHEATLGFRPEVDARTHANARAIAALPDLLDLIEAQAAQVEALQQELADTNDTLNAWFDTAKIIQDQIGPKMLDAAKGYLRTSRSGGMPAEVSDTVAAVIEDMLRLGYLTAPVTQYVMTAALATEPRHE